MAFEPRERYLQQVRRKGYKAFGEGLDLEDNPHPWDPEPRERWAYGWLDAERDSMFTYEGAEDHGLD